MSKRESRRGGSSKTARVRGKEGDFFSSCKPFQLCSGLRTETGSERKREQSLGAHTSQREREREEKERRGTGIAWHFVSFSVREQEKEEGKEKSKREGSVSWDCLLVERGEILPAKQSLDWSWEGCLGLCPLDTVPRLTALPCSPACLPGWSRIQPQPPFLSTPRCPLSL